MLDRKWLTGLPRAAFALAMGVGLLVSGTGGTSASAGTSISAGSASLEAGEQGTSTAVVTRAAADAHFNAYDVTLSFDPGVATVAAVVPAAGWSLMPAPRIDNGAGTVQVIAVRFNECGTTCPIFSITWNGVTAGSTPLELAGNANESLAGAGEYITSDFVSGVLTVEAPAPPPPSPSPTSSPTASPTATPTPPAPPAPGGPAVIVGGSGGAPVGKQITTGVSAMIGASGQVDSFDVELAFDPEIATVASVTPGDGWGFAPEPVIDNVTGRITVSALRFGDCAPACQLFEITWDGVAHGTMKPALVGSSDQVLGRTGAYVPATFVEGVVTVAGKPANAPGAPAAPGDDASPAVPSLPIQAGWNLVTWGGETLSPKDALAASNPDAIEIMYVWDAEEGRWRRYGPKLPSFVNDLDEIRPGDVIWLSASR